VLGDACAVGGDAAAAEARYREALAADPTDSYTRGALADLLLDLARPAEAAAVLEGHVDNDGQLLRLVLAAKGAHRDDAGWLQGRLQTRVEEARRRGDVVHQREEARYALRLEEDPERALALAIANFGVQREPWDVRLLLEAAAAAGKPDAAKPALAWMTRTGFEDARLKALAKELSR
jgi:Tetratricopeptide repeat